MPTGMLPMLYAANPLDNGGHHGQRVHGLARVSYVGDNVSGVRPSPTNCCHKGILNSYIKTQYECFSGRSTPLYGLKRKAKKTTTYLDRHITVTKKTLEGKFKIQSTIEKRSEIVIQFSRVFLPFLAKKLFQIPDLATPNDFLQKIWNGWPANHSRFFGLPDIDF
jgi:hypothetical protein